MTAGRTSGIAGRMFGTGGKTTAIVERINLTAGKIAATAVRMCGTVEKTSVTGGRIAVSACARAIHRTTRCQSTKVRVAACVSVADRMGPQNIVAQVAGSATADADRAATA